MWGLGLRLGKILSGSGNEDSMGLRCDKKNLGLQSLRGSSEVVL